MNFVIEYIYIVVEGFSLDKSLFSIRYKCIPLRDDSSRRSVIFVTTYHEQALQFFGQDLPCSLDMEFL